MKPEQQYTYTLASNGLLRWFTDPGPAVPAHIRLTLLGELFTSPVAVVMGVANGLIINSYALYVCGGKPFLAIMVLDIGLAVLRVVVARRVFYAASHGLVAPTDLALTTSLLWCGIQGAMAFEAMRTGMYSLAILGGTTIVGLIGPICARNYAAPRWALLLVAVTYFPFIIGTVSTGETWPLLIFLQAPLFVYGSLIVIRRFQALAIANLIARHDSQYIAIHDPLTGLLNRAGLMQSFEDFSEATQNSSVLFYLDLDGFKSVNDTFGHQAGDQLLTQVAKRLKARTQPQDVVARLGGDEFVILAIGMEPAAGAGFAEELIGEVVGQPYMLNLKATARVSVSVGYACCPEDAMSLEMLQQMADTALYESKHAGKGTHRRFINQVGVSKDQRRESGVVLAA